MEYQEIFSSHGKRWLNIHHYYTDVGIILLQLYSSYYTNVQWAIVNALEIDGKVENLSRERRYKQELKNTVSEKRKTSLNDSIAKRNKILKNCTELQGTMGK